MRWTQNGFCYAVFLRYGAKLVGWPIGIDFANLSKVSWPTATVHAILAAWESSEMRWEAISLGERMAAMEDPRNACPGPLFQDPISRGQRNDVGKRRDRPAVDSSKYPPRYVRDGPKSARRVDTDSEPESEGEVEEIEDADEFWGPVARPSRVARGELADDLIESF